MTRYLHTMLRITNPERSGKFYGALGLEFRRELPIVRDGHHEATNYFFSLGDARAFAAQRLRLTEAGRDVLGGKANRVQLLGLDRWLGGTHLLVEPG